MNKAQNKNRKIFVINLAKSSDRRSQMIDKFSALNAEINYQFFTAVHGKETPNHPLFAKHNSQKRQQRKGSATTLGQLGCFASHYLLWEKCVELNEGIIVMEDDALLLDNFLNTYHFLSSADNTFEFLWLCLSLNGGKHKTVANFPAFNLNVERFYLGFGNTACYYITPQAAKKLLAYCEEWIWNVDISMDRYYENKLNFYGVLPACVQQDYTFTSDVPLNKEDKRTLATKIRREFYNACDRFKRTFYNLSH